MAPAYIAAYIINLYKYTCTDWHRYTTILTNKLLYMRRFKTDFVLALHRLAEFVYDYRIDIIFPHWSKSFKYLSLQKRILTKLGLLLVFEV